MELVDRMSANVCSQTNNQTKSVTVENVDYIVPRVQ